MNKIEKLMNVVSSPMIVFDDQGDFSFVYKVDVDHYVSLEGDVVYRSEPSTDWSHVVGIAAIGDLVMIENDTKLEVVRYEGITIDGISVRILLPSYKTSTSVQSVSCIPEEFLKRYRDLSLREQAIRRAREDADAAEQDLFLMRSAFINNVKESQK